MLSLRICFTEIACNIVGGGSGVGPPRGCVDGQKIKKFIAEDNETVKEGFCQSDEDLPFRVAILDLDFTFFDEDGLVLNLKARHKPDIKFLLSRIIMHEYDGYYNHEYCLGFDRNRKLTIQENMGYLMFGNPVLSEWYDDDKTMFRFKSLLGNRVLLWDLSPFVFKIKSLPQEYHESFFSELENFIKQFVKQDLKSGYQDFCSSYEEKQ